jgi:hypothetical protein
MRVHTIRLIENDQKYKTTLIVYNPASSSVGKGSGGSMG